MKDIAIYGAGGFGREVACLIHAINNVKQEWNLIGFFDDVHELGFKNEYGVILGGMEQLNDYDKDLALVIAIGSPTALKNLSSRIVNPLIYFPNIIAPDVIFYDRDSVSLGKGNIVLFHSMISCNVHIGDFNLLNTDVAVGHDSIIGSYNVMNPSVRVSGNVKIGDTNLLGVSSVVLERIVIGNQIVLGANSVLIHKSKDGNTYIGNPALIMKF